MTEKIQDEDYGRGNYHGEHYADPSTWGGHSQMGVHPYIAQAWGYSSPPPAVQLFPSDTNGDPYGATMSPYSSHLGSEIPHVGTLHNSSN
jgi:hypothetical protein